MSYTVITRIMLVFPGTFSGRPALMMTLSPGFTKSSSLAPATAASTRASKSSSVLVRTGMTPRTRANCLAACGEGVAAMMGWSGWNLDIMRAVYPEQVIAISALAPMSSAA